MYMSTHFDIQVSL